MVGGLLVSLGHSNFFLFPPQCEKIAWHRNNNGWDLLSMYSSRNSPAVMGGLLDIIGTVKGKVFDERWMQGLLEGKGEMNEWRKEGYVWCE